nr:large conductance mechanosensitive channel protein MscL [Pseudoclavibacter sp. Marseille-Q3772]
MNGFKEFIMRGNVIELATAVIMGNAFTAIVTAIVDGIFTPLIAALFNAEEIEKAVLTVGNIHFGVGLVIAAIIKFLLIALVVYFAIIFPMNKLNEKMYVRKHGHLPPEEEVPVEETDVLIEIRDLLAARQVN